MVRSMRARSSSDLLHRASSTRLASLSRRARMVSGSSAMIRQRSAAEKVSGSAKAGRLRYYGKTTTYRKANRRKRTSFINVALSTHIVAACAWASRSAGKDGYRDRLHDLHNVDIDRCLVFRRDYHRYSFLARVPVPRLSRASVATCWKNCLIGSAGEPQTSSPAETSRITPL